MGRRHRSSSRHLPGRPRAFGLLLAFCLLGWSLLSVGIAAAAGDSSPPTVSIVTPSAGADVSGTVVVSGTASDDRAVRAVHVVVDGGGPHAATGTTSWSYSLDADRLSSGSHTITAIATDTHGNDGTASIAVVVSGTGTGTVAASGSYVHPAPAVLGVWSDGKSGHTIEVLESQIGKKFGGIRNNQRIFDDLPGKDEIQSFDAGRRYSVRNAATNKLVGGRKVATCWKDWANGTYDSRLAQIVTSLKADTRWSHSTPYVFAFHKEMNINGSSQPTCGTPEEYKAAARHVYTYFYNAGILWRTGGKVLMAWVPTASAFRNGDAYKWDPDLGSNGSSIVGDYYDLVGEDIYDRIDTGGHLKTTDPHWLFDPAHTYAVARGKQLIFPEFGVEEDSANDGVSEKAVVLSKVVSVLSSYGTTGPGSVAAVYYSDASPYWANSSATALAAFKKMARDPFFGG
jgi:Bacterial Ig domain